MDSNTVTFSNNQRQYDRVMETMMEKYPLPDNFSVVSGKTVVPKKKFNVQKASPK